MSVYFMVNHKLIESKPNSTLYTMPMDKYNNTIILVLVYYPIFYKDSIHKTTPTVSVLFNIQVADGLNSLLHK